MEGIGYTLKMYHNIFEGYTKLVDKGLLLLR